MSKTDTKQAPAHSTDAIVFGIADNGKPQAARFDREQADLAARAAQALHLKLVRVTSPALADIAARLPQGSIHATGKAVVPFVSPALHAQLVDAIDGKSAADSRGFPDDWSKIDAGHLVLAQESPEDGWWEAIVTGRDGDMLTLKWRDYPKYKPFPRHRLSVALLSPNGQ